MGSMLTRVSWPPKGMGGITILPANSSTTARAMSMALSVSRFVLLFMRILPPAKKCRIANPSRCNATRSGISYVHLSLRRY